MHPIDIAPRDEQETERMPGGGGAGFWAIAALVAVVALVIALLLAFSGDGEGGQPAPESPAYQAPLDPGRS